MRLCPHNVCQKAWVEEVQSHLQQYAHAEATQLADQHCFRAPMLCVQPVVVLGALPATGIFFSVKSSNMNNADLQGMPHACACVSGLAQPSVALSIDRFLRH